MTIINSVFDFFRTYPFISPLIGAILGFILKALWDMYRERRNFKKELKDNNDIDVTDSNWIAAWQTSVDSTEIVNIETLNMVQKGQTVQICNKEKAPENPKGGYLWEAQMQFFQGRHLMGWYFPIKSENNTSKGIMFFTYLSQKKIFCGRWVGAAYDGDLVSGFVAISKDKTVSIEELNRLKAHPDPINIITNSY